jgi:hypothetical protein
MTKNHKNIILVDSQTPPVVELDSAAHAAYVRFSNKKIHKTAVVDVRDVLVTMDLDIDAGVVGVELVGVKDFTIKALFKRAGITGMSDKILQRTSYVPANPEPVLA